MTLGIIELNDSGIRAELADRSGLPIIRLRIRAAGHSIDSVSIMVRGGDGNQDRKGPRPRSQGKVTRVYLIVNSLVSRNVSFKSVEEVTS